MSLVARIFFIIICWIGIYTNVQMTNSDSFMGGGTALNFYTIQSNILVLLVQFILLFCSFFDLSDKPKILRGIVLLKYVTTTAIMLTFLVFWGMLAPYMDLKSLVEPSCILVHFVTPILMLLDFLRDKSDVPLKKSDAFYTIIPPVYYLIFCLVRAEISDVKLTGGSRFPYWFIDIDMFGWFGNENGIGVFFWVMLILIIVLTISFGLRFVKKKLNGAKI